jgi:hypothetical protein
MQGEVDHLQDRTSLGVQAVRRAAAVRGGRGWIMMQEGGPWKGCTMRIEDQTCGPRASSSRLSLRFPAGVDQSPPAA